MSLKGMVNKMVLEELIQGLLTNVKDKTMIKDKGEEALKFLEKLDESTCLILVKLDGAVSVSLMKKEDISGFNKAPDFLNIEEIIRNTIDSI